ncbi:MAG: sigma-70 family RNA polymerase sigma factor [Planctomycetes bacterium]|nr:sigma-70 family RNA polymerase sigma factor [Planctomycetota bacterium]
MSTPTTHMSLLCALQNPDQQEYYWPVFVQRYSPVIAVWSVNHGLPVRFADDLTQEILIKVFRSLSTYDPEKGRFRTWLGQIIRTTVIDHYRKQEKVIESQAIGGTAFQEAMDHLQDPLATEELATSMDSCVDPDLAAAMERVRSRVQDSTWQVFEKTVLEGKPVLDVAKELNLTKAAVHQGKYRVSMWIREEYLKITDAATVK